MPHVYQASGDDGDEAGDAGYGGCYDGRRAARRIPPEFASLVLSNLGTQLLPLTSFTKLLQIIAGTSIVADYTFWIHNQNQASTSSIDTLLSTLQQALDVYHQTRRDDVEQAVKHNLSSGIPTTQEEKEILEKAFIELILAHCISH